MSNTGQFVGGEQSQRMTGAWRESTTQMAFQEAVLRALQLPRDYREVFVLSEIQGHGVVETAKILGIELDTASKRLRRARQMLSCAPAAHLWNLP